MLSKHSKSQSAGAYLVLFGIALWAVAATLARLPITTGISQMPIWTFAEMAAGNLLVLAGLGQAITRSWLGVLRSGRNTLSLARLQMTAWTVLILSALFAVAALRTMNSLSVGIPPELLQAMGISYVSAAAAPAILSLRGEDPTPAQVQAASSRLGEQILASGQTVYRPDGAGMRLSDLIRSDDLAGAGTVDLGKVQQLMITGLVLVVYTGMLLALFQNGNFGEARTQLPKFSSDFVTLLLVSHGSYLAIKAAPKTDTSAAAAPQRPVPPSDRNAT